MLDNANKNAHEVAELGTSMPGSPDKEDGGHYQGVPLRYPQWIHSATE
jgi:hypothetical protein